MDAIERLMRSAKPLPPALAGGGSLPRRALVHASLATTATVSRRGRHLTGTFCLTGDTMEGIIQCLVFLKAFSVSGTHVVFYKVGLRTLKKMSCGLSAHQSGLTRDLATQAVAAHSDVTCTDSCSNNS